MLADILLPDPEQMHLEEIILDGQTLELIVRGKSATVSCPTCGTWSTRVHSGYHRTLADVSCAGRCMRLRWNVRRFFCDNPGCGRITYAEQIPTIAPRYARKTQRLVQQQTGIAFEVGGEPGARLATAIWVPTSPDTLLRGMRTCGEASFPTPAVLGVDDWALRKGQTYGTLLVDLETHQAIDLLPERSAEAFTDWLLAHPGVKIISRDRSREYAKGASQGAPEALQVADRWHLLKNLREALEKFMEQNQACLHTAANAPPVDRVQPAPTNEDQGSQEGLVPDRTANTSHLIEKPPPLTKAAQARQTRRANRLARYQQVVDLHHQGVGIRAIARQMGLNRTTVRKYVQAGTFPEIGQRRKMPSKLDPYCAYLQTRWETGVHNRLQLWREIRSQGFQGSQLLVYRWAQQNGLAKVSRSKVARKHTGKQAELPKNRPWSANRAAWLLLKEASGLDSEDQAALQRMRQVQPHIELAQKLAHEFKSIVQNRQAEQLANWFNQVMESEIDPLKSFVNGLGDDLAAVEAALQLPWSNGVTEGQVNRLKLVKRQMYGRANFDLLRKRFLGMPPWP